MGSVTLLTKVVGGLDKKQHFSHKKWSRPISKVEKLRTRILKNLRLTWKNENPDEPARSRPELRKRNKKGRPKKPRRPPGNRLKLRPRLPGRRAKPLLLCQIRTSTREAMSRRPTVGTVRSVICTLRCIETSCKQKKQQLHNNLDHNIVNLVGFDPLFNKNYLLF